MKKILRSSSIQEWRQIRLQLKIETYLIPVMTTLRFPKVPIEGIITIMELRFSELLSHRWSNTSKTTSWCSNRTSHSTLSLPRTMLPRFSAKNPKRIWLTSSWAWSNRPLQIQRSGYIPKELISWALIQTPTNNNSAVSHKAQTSFRHTEIIRFCQTIICRACWRMVHQDNRKYLALHSRRHNRTVSSVWC